MRGCYSGIAVAVLFLAACGIRYAAAAPEFPVARIADDVRRRQDGFTRLCVSHSGDPRFAEVGFTYDQALAALFFSAAGLTAEAEDMLDMLAALLETPAAVAADYTDSNGVCGLLRVFYDDGRPEPYYAVVNGLSVRSRSWNGNGAVDYFCTPGPQAMLIAAFCQVNPQRYRTAALTLGETLLRWQGPDGAFYDGDREPQIVYTEAHAQAAGAMMLLYQLSGQDRWRRSAEQARTWFEKTVLDPAAATIAQGFAAGRRRDVFATGCYSWTMLGPLGDHLPPALLMALTDTMLARSLARLTVTLPDERRRQVVLADHADATDPAVKIVRGGLHPSGSVEVTGGVIASLMVNSLRLWQAQNSRAAMRYKAVAELLAQQAADCFYATPAGMTTVYATAQDVVVGPFLMLPDAQTGGWRTPYHQVTINSQRYTGGSVAGVLPVIATAGVNPFRRDDWAQRYARIPVDDNARKQAAALLAAIDKPRVFHESEAVTVLDQDALTLITPEQSAADMGKHLTAAFQADDSRLAEESFAAALASAKRMLAQQTWRQLAQAQNNEKAREFGGIIAYPWSERFPLNAHPAHGAILRYPLLNTLGAAMWTAATAAAALDNNEQAHHWIERLVEELPLHQIPDLGAGALIQGYWNGLHAWERNADPRQERCAALLAQYRQTRGIASVLPEIVELPADMPVGIAAVSGVGRQTAPQAAGISRNMWQSLSAARLLSEQHDEAAAGDFYAQAISWAEKMVASAVWCYAARCENLAKEQLFGGLAPPPAAAAGRPEYYAELAQYAALNYIGAGYWCLAYAHAAMGRSAAAGVWIQRLRLFARWQQVPRTDEDVAEFFTLPPDSAYWNGLLWWEQHPAAPGASGYRDALAESAAAGAH